MTEKIRVDDSLWTPTDDSHWKHMMEMEKKIDWTEVDRQLRESDGFYVDPTKSHNYMYGIKNRKFKNEDNNDLVQLTKFAIDIFNLKRLSFEDSHGELKFVTLLNATGDPCAGMVYYFTFEAMNLDQDNKISTYQAIVYNSLPWCPNVVLAFRLKPAPGATKTWFWDDRCSDYVFAEFNINADVANEILDACRRDYAISLTGAVYSLQEIQSAPPGKKTIVLQGSPEQIQEATPIVLERIREFQDYEVAGNETMHVEKEALAKL